VSEDFYCDEALSGRTPVEVPSLIDLGGTDEALLHKVLTVVRRVAEQVTREHGACRVLTNLGRYQDSKHLHFHVNSGDPLR
jgi:histidine triad (HIT) family protein